MWSVAAIFSSQAEAEAMVQKTVGSLAKLSKWVMAQVL